MKTVNVLEASRDEYRVIGISTGHLPESDMKLLTEMGEDADVTMVLSRDTGVFVKLYDSEEPRDLAEDYPGLSETFYHVLGLAREAGYGMVEFDADATAYDGLAWHEW